MDMCTIGGIIGEVAQHKCSPRTSAIAKEEMPASTSQKLRQLSVEHAWASR